MPEISRFYGIVIKMFHNDHAPPHLHAEYGNAKMVVGIDSLRVIAGMLPPRAMGLVMEWMAQHQGELQHAWDQARQMQPIDRVEPLP